MTERPGGAQRMIGLDLAADPRNTGVVLLRCEGPRARASSLPRDTIANDDVLVDLVDATTVVGIDAPLGWPDDFVETIMGHHAMGPVNAKLYGSGDRQNLRMRATDIVVWKLQLGSIPLSVSTDRIGVVALRAAQLQTRWSEAWGNMQPRDGSGWIVETYPAAALRQWQLLPVRGVKYKGGGTKEQVNAQRGERERIMSAIIQETGTWLTIDEELRSNAVDSDHVLDALVCALVAYATKRGVTGEVTPEIRDRAVREGWIHVPQGPLSDLDPK